MAQFKDRSAAGKRLAAALAQYKDQPNTIVLGLPRGGAVVAYEIVKALGLPLDLLLVRKIGAPFDRELAVGAIAYPDVCIVNNNFIKMFGISQAVIDKIIAQEKLELIRRNHVYRRGCEPPLLLGKTVIIADDGIATGANMQAAVKVVSMQKPEKIVLAVPVAASDAIKKLEKEVDEIVCPIVLQNLGGISNSYDDFTQVEDDEVLAILQQVPQYGPNKAIINSL